MPIVNNRILFDQFHDSLKKYFKKLGGISSVYDCGARIYSPQLFEKEKEKILNGDFVSHVDIQQNLYHLYLVNGGNGLSYIVLIYDPFDFFSNEYIIEIQQIDPLSFEKLDKNSLI